MFDDNLAITYRADGVEIGLGQQAEFLTFHEWHARLIGADAVHAVAIEREAICKFLYLAPEIDSEQAEALMAQIRNGEHWKQS